MKTKDKKFDAVKMMRDIRNKLHQEYEKNPEKRKQDLERVRNKYMKIQASSHQETINLNYYQLGLLNIVLIMGQMETAVLVLRK